MGHMMQLMIYGTIISVLTAEGSAYLAYKLYSLSLTADHAVAPWWIAGSVLAALLSAYMVYRIFRVLRDVKKLADGVL